MTDRYTKGVLTVIAAALVTLALEHGVSSAHAELVQAVPPQLSGTTNNDQCGSSPQRPCYIIASGALPVQVSNPQLQVGWNTALPVSFTGAGTAGIPVTWNRPLPVSISVSDSSGALH